MDISKLSCPLPITKHDTVQLSHGSGGKMMNDLISKLFLWAFNNPFLNQKDDSAVVSINGNRIAMSTDTFVVDPPFFPGGNIGELAVNGTVNDVAMSGGSPLFLTTGMILEEGFSMQQLKEITESMRKAADKAGVLIVSGDTKVVNKGKGDKIFINTSGIGIINHNYSISSANLKPGDRIICSGTIADHGMAILSKREGLQFESPIKSDTAALNGMISQLLEECGSAVHALRDPTRGGVAAVLNEFATVANTGIEIEQSKIKVDPAVSGACEFLGLDPMYVANEGKLIAVIDADNAEKALQTIRNHPLGIKAEIIGQVTDKNPGMVTMNTAIGGQRIVDMLVGEQLPRIC